MSGDRIEEEKELLAAIFSGKDAKEPDPLLDTAAFLRVLIQDLEAALATTGESDFVTGIKNGSVKAGKRSAAALVYEKLFTRYQDLLDQLQVAYPVSVIRHRARHEDNPGQE